MRFPIALPSAQAFDDGAADRPIALSSDGMRIVHAKQSGVSQSLFVRALNELEGHPISGVYGSARSPAISPDGQWVAYFANNKLLKVPIGGGTPVE